MDYLNVLALQDVMQVFEQKINLALRYAGLRLPLFKAMDFLEKSGKITVSDLSRQLNVSRATTSTLVNELLRAGIVETTENQSDKRSFYVRLTESGARRLMLARKEVFIVSKSISQQFDDDMIQAVNTFCRTVRQQK